MVGRAGGDRGTHPCVAALGPPTARGPKKGGWRGKAERGGGGGWNGGGVQRLTAEKTLRAIGGTWGDFEYQEGGPGSLDFLLNGSVFFVLAEGGGGENGREG